MAEGVQPGPVVESDGVNQQPVVLPLANRVAQPRRLRIVRLFSPVGEDLTEAGASSYRTTISAGVWMILERNGHQIAGRNAGRQTARGLEVPPFGLEILSVSFRGRGLQRRFVRLEVGEDIDKVLRGNGFSQSMDAVG